MPSTSTVDTIMEVQVLFLCISAVLMVQYPVEGLNCDGANCTVSDQCGENFKCNDNKCVCADGMECDGDNSCKKCPGLHLPCTGCCYPPDQYGCVGDNRRICVCLTNCNDSFVMAAQVALGSALAIAFFALVALFWKTCPRRNRPNGRVTSVARERESSLTSIQRFVVQRLRDRPPRYEDNNQIRLEKPPPYQENMVDDSQVPNTWDVSPPLYSEAVATPVTSVTANNNKPDTSTTSNVDFRGMSERRRQSDSTTSHAGGVENPTFTLQDEGTQSRHSETELHM